MNKTSMKITFFGSGPVAAKSLELLVRNFEIEAVVTKPKPEHHRGDFPVVELANKLNIKLVYARDKAELNNVFAERPVNSKVAVLIDFGIIVSQDIIDYFPLGIVNSHFSLLPEWRGADPIAFAILSGQPKTGVSLMLIDQGMDTGKIITQKSLAISPKATTPSLTAELIKLSDNLLTEYLPGYIDGDIKPRNQPHPDRATYSRKLTKEDGVIDWNKPAAQIEREIRAFIDWPKSRTSLADTEVILTEASVVDGNYSPGEVQATSDAVIVGTAKDCLSILKLKPAGKKEMPVKAFLAGYRGQLN